MTQVRVLSGVYRNEPVVDMVYTMTRPVSEGKNGMFITVDGTPVEGYPDRNVRINITSESDFEVLGEDGATPVAPKETDEEIIERIRERFDILNEMTNATVDGAVRAMVVTGPPGVGKSFGVEKVLKEAEVANKLSNGIARYGVEKGAVSPIGLYQMLYHYSDKGSVMVLDDSDSILYDEEALNMLKAALDSGKTRRIAWRKESKTLERLQIPDEFEFKGSVIFITNLKFDAARGKIKDHLDALLSRCHYLDLTMDTMREKFLRCKQIVGDGMLLDYGFTNGEDVEVMDYIAKNKDRLRELSLRMVTKIADLRKLSPRWEALAESTCIKRGA